jgi:DNA topoisomerase-1
MKAYRWWEAEPLPKGVNYRTLEHQGVIFPPAYKPHGVPLRYEGARIALTPAQEEIATFYAAIPTDGPQLGTANTAKVFNENFFRDFRSALGKDHTVQKFSLCDFSVSAGWSGLVRRARVQAPSDPTTDGSDERIIKRTAGASPAPGEINTCS